jgi:hypothetical protein
MAVLFDSMANHLILLTKKRGPIIVVQCAKLIFCNFTVFAEVLPRKAVAYMLPGRKKETRNE